MKDAQWNQANEEVNNEVVVIDEQHQDVNSLQEKMKYIHIFFKKNVECAGKDDNQKNHVEIEDEDFHYVLEDEGDQLLSIKIQKTKKKNSKYTCNYIGNRNTSEYIPKLQLHQHVLGILFLCLLDLDAKQLIFFIFWNIVKVFILCFNMILLVVIFTCTLNIFVRKI